MAVFLASWGDDEHPTIPAPSREKKDEVQEMGLHGICRRFLLQTGRFQMLFKSKKSCEKTTWHVSQTRSKYWNKLSTNGLAGFLNHQQCVRCSLWKDHLRPHKWLATKGVVSPYPHCHSYQESEAEEPRQWVRVSHEWVGDEVILWFGKLFVDLG